MLAANNGHTEVVSLLLSAGSNVDIQTKVSCNNSINIVIMLILIL